MVVLESDRDADKDFRERILVSVLVEDTAALGVGVPFLVDRNLTELALDVSAPVEFYDVGPRNILPSYDGDSIGKQAKSEQNRIGGSHRSVEAREHWPPRATRGTNFMLTDLSVDVTDQPDAELDHPVVDPETGDAALLAPPKRTLYSDTGAWRASALFAGPPGREGKEPNKHGPAEVGISADFLWDGRAR